MFYRSICLVVISFFLLSRSLWAASQPREDFFSRSPVGSSVAPQTNIYLYLEDEKIRPYTEGERRRLEIAVKNVLKVTELPEEYCLVQKIPLHRYPLVFRQDQLPTGLQIENLPSDLILVAPRMSRFFSPCTMIGDLPQELRLMIFSFLDCKSAVKCSEVSKMWKEEAREPSVWRTIPVTHSPSTLGEAHWVWKRRVISSLIVEENRMKDNWEIVSMDPSIFLPSPLYDHIKDLTFRGMYATDNLEILSSLFPNVESIEFQAVGGSDNNGLLRWRKLTKVNTHCEFSSREFSNKLFSRGTPSDPDSLPITSLTTSLATFEAFSHNKNNPLLQTFSTVKNSLKQLHIKSIKNIEKDNNIIQVINAVSNCTQLQRFGISRLNSTFSDLLLPSILKVLPTDLTHLLLEIFWKGYNGGLTDPKEKSQLNVEALAEFIKTHKSLTELELRDFYISKENLRLFIPALTESNLRRLDISGLSLEADAPMAEFATALASIKTLHTLDMSRSEDLVPHIPAILDALEASNLKVLNIGPRRHFAGRGERRVLPPAIETLLKTFRNGSCFIEK